MIELSIHIKNSESKLVEKHLIYEDFVFSRQDARLLKMLQDATSKFKLATSCKDDDLEIVIKGKLTWQN